MFNTITETDYSGFTISYSQRKSNQWHCTLYKGQEVVRSGFFATKRELLEAAKGAADSINAGEASEEPAKF